MQGLLRSGCFCVFCFFLYLEDGARAWLLRVTSSGISRVVVVLPLLPCEEDFAVKPRSLPRVLGGCLSLRCCAWRVRDAQPWVIVVLWEEYAIPVTCLLSCSFSYSACWWFRVEFGLFLFLCFVLSLALLWLCIF